MRRKYIITPLEHGLNTEYPSLLLEPNFSPWCKNIKISKREIQKRKGYSLFRTINQEVLNIILYQKKDGNRFMVVLTPTDAIKITSTSWEYITQSYTTGTITNISGATITGNGTSWMSSGVKVGDYFILNVDKGDEPNDKWAKIQSINSDTQITLASNYSGTTGSGNWNYTIRKIYDTPPNYRWGWAIVGDLLCFSNGNNPVQKWNGSGYASNLHSNAVPSRFLIEYADRLILFDCVVNGVRNPNYCRWSAIDDPTNWTGVGSGYKNFVETEDFITGVGKSGTFLVVYKRNSIILGSDTGDIDIPIIFPNILTQVGCIAPYSIVNLLSGNVFLGYDNFYYIESGTPRPIGDKIKDIFFELVNTTEAEKTTGFLDQIAHEILWFVNTTEGRLAFVWDYKEDEWYIYEFKDNILTLGKGTT